MDIVIVVQSKSNLVQLHSWIAEPSRRLGRFDHIAEVPLRIHIPPADVVQTVSARPRLDQGAS